MDTGEGTQVGRCAEVVCGIYCIVFFASGVQSSADRIASFEMKVFTDI